MAPSPNTLSPIPKPIRTKKTTLISDPHSLQALNTPNGSAEKDLEILDGLIGLYRRATHANPVGLNDEITADLRGHNPKGVAVLPQSHPAINDQGELVDRWGSPYFFHAISGKQMEIRSAEPDRKLYTDDDLHR